MKILQKTGTFLIALVFLLGSTGISFYRHTCYSSNSQKTIVYPGLFKPAVSCCCGGTSNAGGSSEIDIASCCKSATTLIKLGSGYVPSVNMITIAPETTVQPCLSLKLAPLTDGPGLSAANHNFEFYSPPLSGRRLLYFLHQIKVPSFSFLA